MRTLDIQKGASPNRLTKEHETLFFTLLREIEADSRFSISRKFIQHGTTSIYRHSRSVAYLSCLIAERLHLSVNWHDMIRGALLHDYFLYDWHHRREPHILPHGFTHARSAYDNAVQDFCLTPLESTIILRHMFPLTPIPPTCREAWLVCLADKITSTRETISPYTRSKEKHKQKGQI